MIFCIQILLDLKRRLLIEGSDFFDIYISFGIGSSVKRGVASILWDILAIL